MEEEEIPIEFLCPIFLTLMQDPVVASDGLSYEREAIEQWFSLGHTTSPSTGEELESKNLVPNFTLRSLLQSFEEATQVQEEESKSPSSTTPNSKSGNNIQLDDNESVESVLSSEVGERLRGLPSLEVSDFVLENQRWAPGLGWSPNNLFVNAERPPFQVRGGDHLKIWPSGHPLNPMMINNSNSSSSLSEAHLPNLVWQWIDRDWTLQREVNQQISEDPDCWFYAHAWPSSHLNPLSTKFATSKKVSSLVRRRVWRRRRRQLPLSLLTARLLKRVGVGTQRILSTLVLVEEEMREEEEKSNKNEETPISSSMDYERVLNHISPSLLIPSNQNKINKKRKGKGEKVVMGSLAGIGNVVAFTAGTLVEAVNQISQVPSKIIQNTTTSSSSSSNLSSSQNSPQSNESPLISGNQTITSFSSFNSSPIDPLPSQPISCVLEKLSRLHLDEGSGLRVWREKNSKGRREKWFRILNIKRDTMIIRREGVVMDSGKVDDNKDNNKEEEEEDGSESEDESSLPVVGFVKTLTPIFKVKSLEGEWRGELRGIVRGEDGRGWCGVSLRMVGKLNLPAEEYDEKNEDHLLVEEYEVNLILPTNNIKGEEESSTPKRKNSFPQILNPRFLVEEGQKGFQQIVNTLLLPRSTTNPQTKQQPSSSRTNQNSQQQQQNEEQENHETILKENSPWISGNEEEDEEEDDEEGWWIREGDSDSVMHCSFSLNPAPPFNPPLTLSSFLQSNNHNPISSFDSSSSSSLFQFDSRFLRVDLSTPSTTLVSTFGMLDGVVSIGLASLLTTSFSPTAALSLFSTLWRDQLNQITLERLRTDEKEEEEEERKSDGDMTQEDESDLYLEIEDDD